MRKICQKLNAGLKAKLNKWQTQTIEKLTSICVNQVVSIMPNQPTTPLLPPFIWNEDRRAILRAELDAYYAKLYGLTSLKKPAKPVKPTLRNVGIPY